MVAPTAEEWHIQANSWDFILFDTKLFTGYGLINKM